MTQAAKQVVVGVDGSESDKQTLLWAADEAQRRGCGVLVAHGRDVMPREVASDAPVVSVFAEGQDFAVQLVSDSAAVVAGRQPSVPVLTMLEQQKPAELLVELSRDAELIVLGTHGDGRFIGALLGSVSQKLAAHAHCPVVVLPAGPAPLPDSAKAVVVGISPSAGGKSALGFAFAEAQNRGATVVAVRSWGEAASMGLGYATGTIGMGYVGALPIDALREAGQAILDECVGSVRSGFPDVAVRTELTGVPVDQALLECSNDASLLVVGCRHEDGHRLSRLGPFGSWLLHNSTVPIAVVGYTG